MQRAAVLKECGGEVALQDALGDESSGKARDVGGAASTNRSLPFIRENASVSGWQIIMQVSRPGRFEGRRLAERAVSVLLGVMTWSNTLPHLGRNRD